MSLTLYYHPLASFCWKPLIALYENGTRFSAEQIDLQEEVSRRKLLEVWPMGEFPVLIDRGRDRVVPQSSAILEYLELHHPGPAPIIPRDPDSALEARRWDAFYDSYLQVPMQKIVSDTFRPEGSSDRIGVEEARDLLRSAYGILETQLAGKTWTLGHDFSSADCSAAPALFYSDQVEPLGKAYPNLTTFLARLKQRPSFARVLEEARPYFRMFPLFRGEGSL